MKRNCIKVLPHTLVIHLKRFEFDFEAMSRWKIKSRCADRSLPSDAPHGQSSAQFSELRVVSRCLAGCEISDGILQLCFALFSVNTCCGLQV